MVFRKSVFLLGLCFLRILQLVDKPTIRSKAGVIHSLQLLYSPFDTRPKC